MLVQYYMVVVGLTASQRPPWERHHCSTASIERLKSAMNYETVLAAKNLRQKKSVAGKSFPLDALSLCDFGQVIYCHFF